MRLLQHAFVQIPLSMEGEREPAISHMQQYWLECFYDKSAIVMFIILDSHIPIMKSQNFPGFIAEGSLFQSSNQYLVNRSNTMNSNSSIMAADEQMLEAFSDDSGLAKSYCMSGDQTKYCKCAGGCASGQNWCNCY